jgi:hypothetical protein
MNAISLVGWPASLVIGKESLIEGCGVVGISDIHDMVFAVQNDYDT